MQTIQCIAFLSHLFHERHCTGPFLVVVPLSTITAWQREFTKWASDINVVVYVGTKQSREIIRSYEWFATPSKGRAHKSRYRFHVVLTTFDFLMRDKAWLGGVQWAHMMIDEAHRLKDHHSQMYKILHSFQTDHRLLITGTPLQNSMTELWCLLHFIQRDKFPSLPDFQAKHGHVSSGDDLASLHAVLKPHLLRRTKADVLKSLPSKKEKILLVEMSALQRKYARWILRRNYRDLNKGMKGKKASLSNIIMELKKVCNHPYLTRPPEEELEGEREDGSSTHPSATPSAHLSAPSSDAKSASDSYLLTLIKDSGKLVLLDKLLTRLKATGHRVLIFSQMVKMLDILADYLRLRGFVFQRLDGGMRSQDRQYAMDHFNAPNSPDFCFILSTKAGGLGINLATADTVIIFDSDWNPQVSRTHTPYIELSTLRLHPSSHRLSLCRCCAAQNDLQAEARAHRIGQKNSVNIYRFVTRNTVEEDILQRAKQKMILDHLVIQRMDTSGRTVIPSAGQGGSAFASSSALFDSRELAKILQFGAEDLFAENKEDEATSAEKRMEDMDIDEILSRAEHKEEVEGGQGGETKEQDQTETFLSGFKVASFKTGEAAGADEEDEAAEEEKKQREEEGQIEFWSRVIPASMIPADQLQEEGAPSAVPLFLPPRQRKAVQSYNENRLRHQSSRPMEADGEEAGGGSDSSELSDDDTKRGRKRRKEEGELSAKDVKLLYRHLLWYGDEGRVIREMERGTWKQRLQDEAFKAKVREIIHSIQDACEEAVRNPPHDVDDDAATGGKAGGKKGGKRAADADDDDEGGGADDEPDEGGKRKKAKKKLTIEFRPGVFMHPLDLLDRRRGLHHLSLLISQAPDPLKFRLTRTSKPVQNVRWSQCIWKTKQDAMLMYGVFLYGMNGWDAIVEDPRLKLKECIVIRRKKQQQPGAGDGRATTSSATQPPTALDEGSEMKEAEGGKEVTEPRTGDGGEPSSQSSTTPSDAPAGAMEMEEIRTVKNTQLAARAAHLLRLLSVDDEKDRKKKKKSSDGLSKLKPAKASKPLDDAHKKRARVDVDVEAMDEEKVGDKKRVKKEREEDAAAADDDDFEVVGDSAPPPTASKKRVKKERPTTVEGSKGKKEVKVKKEELNMRIDEMFRPVNRTSGSDAATKGRTLGPSAAAVDTNGRLDESKEGKEKGRDAKASSSLPKRPLLPSPPVPRDSLKGRSDSHKSTSTSSNSHPKQPLNRGVPQPPHSPPTSNPRLSEDGEFIEPLLTWIKVQFSAVTRELKELYQYAHDDKVGGLKGHQHEVRLVLLRIGREAERLVGEETKGTEVQEELDRHIWHYVSMYTKMKGGKLKKLYNALRQEPGKGGGGGGGGRAEGGARGGGGGGGKGGGGGGGAGFGGGGKAHAPGAGGKSGVPHGGAVKGKR